MSYLLSAGVAEGALKGSRGIKIARIVVLLVFVIILLSPDGLFAHLMAAQKEILLERGLE